MTLLLQLLVYYATVYAVQLTHRQSHYLDSFADWHQSLKASLPANV